MSSDDDEELLRDIGLRDPVVKDVQRLAFQFFTRLREGNAICSTLDPRTLYKQSELAHFALTEAPGYKGKEKYPPTHQDV